MRPLTRSDHQGTWGATRWGRVPIEARGAHLALLLVPALRIQSIPLFMPQVLGILCSLQRANTHTYTKVRADIFLSSEGEYDKTRFINDDGTRMMADELGDTKITTRERQKLFFPSEW